MADAKKRILIVEDDKILSIMYKTKLEADGYEILVADNGSDALEMAKSSQPDLVLLDVIIPQLDGFSVLEEIRSNISKDLPVVMLTNLGTDEDRKKGETMGANDYLVKANLVPEQVSEKVKQYLK